MGGRQLHGRAVQAVHDARRGKDGFARQFGNIQIALRQFQRFRMEQIAQTIDQRAFFLRVLRQSQSLFVKIQCLLDGTRAGQRQQTRIATQCQHFMCKRRCFVEADATQRVQRFRRRPFTKGEDGDTLHGGVITLAGFRQNGQRAIVGQFTECFQQRDTGLRRDVAAQCVDNHRRRGRLVFRTLADVDDHVLQLRTFRTTTDFRQKINDNRQILFASHKSQRGNGFLTNFLVFRQRVIREQLDGSFVQTAAQRTEQFRTERGVIRLVGGFRTDFRVNGVADHAVQRMAGLILARAFAIRGKLRQRQNGIRATNCFQRAGRRHGDLVVLAGQKADCIRLESLAVRRGDSVHHKARRISGKRVDSRHDFRQRAVDFRQGMRNSRLH